MELIHKDTGLVRTKVQRYGVRYFTSKRFHRQNSTNRPKSVLEMLGRRQIKGGPKTITPIFLFQLGNRDVLSTLGRSPKSAVGQAAARQE